MPTWLTVLNKMPVFVFLKIAFCRPCMLLITCSTICQFNETVCKMYLIRHNSDETGKGDLKRNKILSYHRFG